MSDQTEYEIEYTVRRRRPGDEDFADIGFGISGMWTSPEQCAYIVMSDVQNYGWEAERGMPDPQEVKREVEETR